MSDYLQERRDRVAGAWALTDECVLVGAGGPLPLPGSDQFHELRVHPEFLYLADGELQDAVLAFDPAEGAPTSSDTSARETITGASQTAPR